MANELKLSIEVEREADGRWIAEVPELPGVMAYGETRVDAIASAVKLALEVIDDEVEHGERAPMRPGPVFAVAA